PESYEGQTTATTNEGIGRAASHEDAHSIGGAAERGRVWCRDIPLFAARPPRDRHDRAICTPVMSGTTSVPASPSADGSLPLTPVTAYTARTTVNADAAVFVQDDNASRCGFQRWQQRYRRWIAVRHQLSATVFARPIPFCTAKLHFKLGDLLLTGPVILGVTAWSCISVSQFDTQGSGTPPMLTMIAVFALAVRNNSPVLALTGLSFERALFYHRLMGLVTFVLTSLHGLSWLLPDQGIGGGRRRLQQQQHTDKRRVSDDGSVQQAWLSVPEHSGAVLFYLMLALVLLSVNFVRRRFFELFLRMHWLLFLAIIVFCIIHGAATILAGVVPWFLDAVFRFACVVPRNSKLTRSLTTGTEPAERLIQITKLPGDCLRIQFPRVHTGNAQAFEYEAGQYLFICIPSIAKLEWHPFTISSAPHEDLVTLHIRVQGNWTRKLSAAINSVVGETEIWQSPVLIDGPYGEVSIDVFNPTVYRHVVLFSGGIGVTPMQSIASQLSHESRPSLRRLWFVWSIRDCTMLDAMTHKSISNSSSTLGHLFAARRQSEVLVTDVYITQPADRESIDHPLADMLHVGTRPDVLATLLSMGHEAKEMKQQRVAVLVCGPPSMVASVVVQSLLAQKELGIAFDPSTPTAAYAAAPPDEHASSSTTSTTGSRWAYWWHEWRRRRQQWIALRFQLSRSLFARPVPFCTAQFDAKFGDLLVTLPLVVILVAWSCVTTAQLDTKSSGTPPQLLLLLVFALAVRNNAVLLTATGLSFERALFYLRAFGVVAFALTGSTGCRGSASNDHVLRQREHVQHDDKGFLSQAHSGAVLFYAMLALSLLSLNVIRRKFFDLFLRLHWALFLVILFFSVIHGAGLVLVGAIPRLIDVVFRHFVLTPTYAHGKTRLATIAAFEWHPFTISSAPYEDMVTLHIRVQGDWTRRVMDAFPIAMLGQSVPFPFPVQLDGPYGEVSVDIMNADVYGHVALFAGGIGVTPMVSIAKQLYHDQATGGRMMLDSMRFVWSVRTREMIDAMVAPQTAADSAKVEAQLGQFAFTNSTVPPVTSELYVTHEVAVRDGRLNDVVHCSKRPDIYSVLYSMGEQALAAGSQRVAVLVCGPGGMSTEVCAKSLAVAKQLQVAFVLCIKKRSSFESSIKWHFSEQARAAPIFRDPRFESSELIQVPCWGGT
ncbi:TPA: hypothetical protein N0F65_005761, partial [Lagenidium giganteum]